MIYLDHAATTPIIPEVNRQLKLWYDELRVGNAGSSHSQGFAARAAIEEARKNIADLIGAEACEIFFTSGATEGNNMFLRFVKDTENSLLISSPIEHASIINTAKELGIETKFMDCVNGVTRLNSELFDRTKNNFITLIAVNNELGTEQPFQRVKPMLDLFGINAVFHVDATQAIGHRYINVKMHHIDVLTASGHKFGAPIGTGFIYIKKDLIDKFKPMIYGGNQENGLRSGTENVAGIVAMGTAARVVRQDMHTNCVNYFNCRKDFNSMMERLVGEDNYRINGDNRYTVENIINITFFGVNAESLMMALDQEGVYVSAGSACSTGKQSHVLKAIGMSDDEIDQTIRVSFGWTTTEIDVIDAAVKIAKCIKKIKEMNA